MLTFIRQSTHQLRLWLIAAAAVLALTSVLEAGHAHGVVGQADDQCVLCQHSVTLDKFLSSPQALSVPLLLAVFASGLISCFIPQHTRRLTSIRAPPTLLHAR